MKILSMLFAFIFCAYGITASVVWQFHEGYNLDSKDKYALLELAGEIGFNDIYEVEVGIFGKYDSSIVAIAKQIIATDDTTQRERWLYLWKREWIDSQHYRAFGDSSIVNKTFVTGQGCIKLVNKFIYRHGNEKRTFQFVTSFGSYEDVRIILDCVIDDFAVEDRMKFKAETKKTWEILKKNILNFKSVMYWGKYYSFEYYLPVMEPTEYVVEVKRVGNGCEILYAGPRGAGN